MLQFRERIDSAVTEAGIQIRNLGNVHKVELADNLFLLEVQFSADGKTAGAVAFLRTAMEDHPRLFWEVITVKPGTETLNITGTICSVCMIRQNVPKEGK